MSKSTTKNLNTGLNNFFQNEFVSWGLRILLVLYAAMVAPNINKDISYIFDSVIVRLIIACLIVFLSFHDTTLAILLAIAFVVSIQTLNKHKVNQITNLPESFMDQENSHMEGHNESFMDQEHSNMEGHKESFMDKDHSHMEGHNESFMDQDHSHMEGHNESFMGQDHSNMEGHNESFMGQEHSQMEGHNESFMGNDFAQMENNYETFMGGNQEEHTEHKENFMGEEHNMTENFVGNMDNNQPSVCGGPNNQFTTHEQLNDAGNNLVNNNQNNSVATFCPELNAQGSNPPQGFTWDNYTPARY